MITITNVLAFEIDSENANGFFLYCDDKWLYYWNNTTKINEKIAYINNISSSKDKTKIYVHYPFVCVVENFGLNGIVISTENKKFSIPIKRKEYFTNCSSYSIGFLERENHVLLIHQTEWNRLDITDLTTGKLLTKRKSITTPKDKNYVDYFHSLLHVSPCSRYFLSNGWVWQPFDFINCYKVEEFLKHFESSGFGIDYWYEANWDRPCTFIDDDAFVIAADIEEDKDEEINNRHEFRFYRITDNLIDGLLPVHKTIDCEIWGTNQYCEIKGNLYYDKTSNYLIAMSSLGTFILTLDGNVIIHNPNLQCNLSSDDKIEILYRFSVNHRLFYGLDEETNEIKTVTLDELLSK
jgi:hypothetical protein